MTSTTHVLVGATWFKSSYSDNLGGNCVEAAHLNGTRMAVRDSKDPHGPALVVAGGAWTGFVAALKAEHLA